MTHFLTSLNLLKDFFTKLILVVSTDFFSKATCLQAFFQAYFPTYFSLIQGINVPFLFSKNTQYLYFACKLVVRTCHFLICYPHVIRSHMTIIFIAQIILKPCHLRPALEVMCVIHALGTRFISFSNITNHVLRCRDIKLNKS